MLSLNKVQIIGNLGADPEFRTIDSGKTFGLMSVATSKRWKDKSTGEQKEATEWHRVSVVSDGLVTVIQKYAKKGAKVYVEGELRTRKWQDKDGVDRYSTEIVVGNFHGQIILLDKAENSGVQAAQADGAAADLDDEIPF